MRELGLTTMQLATSLRAYVNGDVATYWTSPDGEQVDVEIRLPQVSRENVAQLDDLPVAYAKDGTPISLSRVADVVPVVNPVVIKRQDLQRRQAVYASTEGRPSGDVGADVKKIIDETRLPPGYRFDMGGQTRDQQEAFVGVLFALAAAVIFIYIVLASQFSSFLQPLAIMASLPLALIGVMLALLSDGLDAEPVLDDRPGDADGPGDEERDPAGRLRQPWPARRRSRCPRRCSRPAWCGCGRSS